MYSSLFLSNVIYQFTYNQNFYVSFQRQVLAHFDFKHFTNELKEKGIRSYYGHEKQYWDIQSNILIVHDACILESIFYSCMQSTQFWCSRNVISLLQPIPGSFGQKLNVCQQCNDSEKSMEYRASNFRRILLPLAHVTLTEDK